MLWWRAFRPVMADFARLSRTPLKNLEGVAQQFSDHLARVGPGTLEAFVARVGG
jgi:hypothetical protein